jgi:hypothetical protein
MVTHMPACTEHTYAVESVVYWQSLVCKYVLMYSLGVFESVKHVNLCDCTRTPSISVLSYDV